MGFNGAALDRARNLVIPTLVDDYIDYASMEPRSIERGIRMYLELYDGGALASMEPRSIERGIDERLKVRSFNSGASMEPRSIERGIWTGRPFLSTSLRSTLQWSRARSSAESLEEHEHEKGRRRCFNGAALDRARNPST